MISDKQLAEWKENADKAMHSALDEYCPKDEFFELLQAYKDLKAMYHQASGP